MKLIVGLGNPGIDYARTRHNVGFMAVVRLASRHAISSPKHRFQSETVEGPIQGEKCLLMSPLTFMNRSGGAVGEAMRFYKLELSDLLVIVDDIALPCGKLRLRASGSAGGHNGLGDIERVLGSTAYPRLRIGIDPPGRIPQKDYVLGRFTQEQLDEIEPALNRACEMIESWIVDGVDKTMSLFNRGE